MEVTHVYSFLKGMPYDFETLLKGELFLSFPKTFNDPFDCATLIDKLQFNRAFFAQKFGKEILDKISGYDIMKKVHFYNSIAIVLPLALKTLPEEFDVFENLNVIGFEEECNALYKEYLQALDQIKNEYGAACFTLNQPEDSMVMWAHYTRNYKGFCCRFDFDYYNVGTSRENPETIKIFQHLNKVDYCSSFSCLDVEQLLQFHPSELGNSQYVRTTIENAFYKKHNQWQYENEYRLVIHKNDPDLFKTFEDAYGFRIKFPYLRWIYAYGPKAKNLKRIVKMCKNLKIRLSWLATNSGSICMEENKTMINKSNVNMDLESIMKIQKFSNDIFPF